MERRLSEAVLADLYARYGYLVHRRCLAILGNRGDADDAFQEVFMRAQRYGATQAGPSVLAWLYTVAQRCCFDLLSKCGREEPADEARLRELDQRAQGSAQDADRRALLGAALRRLDEKTREIGVLHYLDGLTQEEVAGRTGYSRRTVGKKLKLFGDAVRRQWLEGGIPP